MAPGPSGISGTGRAIVINRVKAFRDSFSSTAITQCTVWFISGKTPQNIFLRVLFHKRRRSGGYAEACGAVLSGK